jgi:nicotinate dehydrogenase subunit A
MDGPAPTTLRVNSTGFSVDVDPDAPLLYVLRNDLGLTAARFGCGEGECGACMVLLDGVPTTSCSLPVSAVRDAEVTTAEGLGTESQPHPLQEAFIELEAAQCGYCLSGVLVSAAALLATNRAPTHDEIRAALRDVLCRCGAHDRMVRAVERAAAIAVERG